MPRSTPVDLTPDLPETLELLGALIMAVQSQELEESGPQGLRALAVALRTRPQLADLPGLLLKTYNEIASALDGIRLTREMIQANALDQIQDSASRLQEVTSTTESATMQLMDGLDRTLGLLDELERGESANAERCATLRGQVNELFAHLQFQDITTQQLHGVVQLLVDVESRVGRVADLFDQAVGGRGVLAPEALASRRDFSTLTFNPDASTRDVGTRQALIDAAFPASAAR